MCAFITFSVKKGLINNDRKNLNTLFEIRKKLKCVSVHCLHFFDIHRQIFLHRNVGNLLSILEEG